MVNHFPNINLLTTKIGLLESLRGYSKIHRYGWLCCFAVVSTRCDSVSFLADRT